MLGIALRAKASKLLERGIKMDDLLSLIDKYTGWVLALIACVGVAKIVQYAIQYQSGNSQEKEDAVTQIRKVLILLSSIGFLVWLTKFLVSEFLKVPIK